MKKPALCFSGIFMVVCNVFSFADPSARLFYIHPDSCNMNDACETAIPIVGVFSGDPFLCITGCNSSALPEVVNNACEMGFFPTTWYRIFTDDAATLINIHVISEDILVPALSLFWETTNCNALTPTPMTPSNLECIIGSNGEAEALGTRVGANTVYYLAVTAMQDQGGSFELCINTIANASMCVVDRNIEITERSTGGSLEGPFLPGETLRVCFHVNSYSAANNGCQWFQGLVPVFGTGWDPSSFDVHGQPLNATINGNAIGTLNNGLFSTATWDWFTDVDYHHADPTRHVGDFDGNGRVDMCSINYDPDCPNTGELKAGCCNPCWGTPLGTILPPGWFAYGVNGSCSTPGPPVRVDWGDGNTCGGGMGPWSFCFDLKVKDLFVCELSSPDNLELGFFTFADGETGAWTGSASNCALDQPAKLRLPVECNLQVDLGTIHLPDVCAGGEFFYQITSPGIENWRWSVSPAGWMSDTVFEAPDGYIIQSHVIQNRTTPFVVVYTFVGETSGNDTAYIRRVRFIVWPDIKVDLPSEFRICERETDTLFLTPRGLTGGNGIYAYAWTIPGQADDTLFLYPPHKPATIGLVVTDDAGCLASDFIQVKLRPCLGDTIPPIDEDNDPPIPQDPPPPDGSISVPSDQIFQRGSRRSDSNRRQEFDIKVYPVPTKDEAVVELTSAMGMGDRIVISNSNGQRCLLIRGSDYRHSKILVHTGSLPDGIYSVSLYAGNEVKTTRLVKM